MQLDLFIDKEAEKKLDEVEKRLPWIVPFPNWMPEVGQPAQINDINVNGLGYSYMERVIIDEIQGDDISCTTQWLGKHMQNHPHQGRKLKIKIWHLWPTFK